MGKEIPVLNCKPRPCESCPYRKDVPSGVWAAEEYDKLPQYDKPTSEQPVGVFMCHVGDNSLCSGWVGCHGKKPGHELLALRFAAISGRLNPAVFDYESPVPLFKSGAEARKNGLKNLLNPRKAAKQLMQKLQRIRKNHG